MQALGVGPQYAATLTSTKDIMQALQQAHQCRQGVLSGQAPILMAADCLPDLPTASGAEVVSLHPSPDSKLMAVVYGGNWTWEIEGHTASEPEVCGLALYETHTGKLLHSLRDDDSSPCSIFWFPCSTRLHVQAYATDTRPFVTYDAVSGLIVPSCWGQPAAAALAEAQKSGGCRWAPDGQHALVCVHGQQYSRRTVHVVHAASGDLLASATLTRVQCKPTCRVGNMMPMWRPDSRSFILPGCTWDLEDKCSLWRAAQLKSGLCPAAVHLTASLSHVSPDGGWLVAPAYVQQDGEMKERVAVMQCTEEAECLRFQLLHVLDDILSSVIYARWCPMPGAAAALLVKKDRGDLQVIALHGQPLGKPAPKVWLQHPTTFSPCGRFCQAFRQMGDLRQPHIVHWESGAVLPITGGKPKPMVDLLWSSCGTCLLRQDAHYDMDGIYCPFTVLRYGGSSA